MKTLVRRALASSLLGTGALILAGCGGGGGGVSTPTATPIGTPGPTTTGTPNATATTAPGTGGSPVTANEVAFVSNRSGSSELYKSSTSGSNVVKLTALGRTIDKPSVANDGNRLVFQLGESNSNGGTNNIEIGVINANGSGFVQLTNDSTPAGRPDDYNPVFSPDGLYIYWTSTRGGTNESGQAVDGVPHIWRMNGALGNTGSNQIQLTHEASAYPSVNRNGTLAYYALNQTTNPIAIANAATGNVTKRVGAATASGQSVFGVTLSPDGTRVAYSVGTVASSGTPASAAIRIYNVASAAAEVNTPTSGSSNRSSAWSRDSNTLYYDATSGGHRQIFASSSPFSSSTQISQDTSSDNYSPAFLPVS